MSCLELVKVSDFIVLCSVRKLYELLIIVFNLVGDWLHLDLLLDDLIFVDSRLGDAGATRPWFKSQISGL